MAAHIIKNKVIHSNLLLNQFFMPCSFFLGDINYVDPEECLVLFSLVTQTM
jgi:hypothetical protein